MARKTITYPIDQKIKVNGDKETADRLQRDVDYFNFGI